MNQEPRTSGPANCLPVEDLAAALEAPRGDLRREHVETCPRCAARVLAYQAMLEPDEPPAGARPEEAEQALRAALARELHAGASTVEAVRRPWFRSRAVYALAAVLTVMVGVGVARQILLEPTPDVILRGDETPAGEGLALKTPVIVEGRIELRWEPWPNATSYEVRLFTASLDELERHAVATTELVLDVPQNADGGILWMVVALRGRDEIAKSRVSTLDVR